MLKQRSCNPRISYTTFHLPTPGQQAQCKCDILVYFRVCCSWMRLQPVGAISRNVKRFHSTGTYCPSNHNKKGRFCMNLCITVLFLQNHDLIALYVVHISVEGVFSLPWSRSSQRKTYKDVKSIERNGLPQMASWNRHRWMATRFKKYTNYDTNWVPKSL